MDSDNKLKNIIELYKSHDMVKLFEFLDTLTEEYNYDRDRHYNDALLADDINRITDDYIKEYTSSHTGSDAEVFDEERTKKRKINVYERIKCARDSNRTEGKTRFIHYVGCDSSSEELARFLYYCYDRYYRLIGCTWVNS